MTSPSINSQLAASLPRPHARVKLDPHDPLTKQAQKWVAQTFFGTLLKQVRESPFHSDLFDGGRGGKAFGEMLDQRLAEHMTRGTGSKLVNALVRKFEASGAYKRQIAKSEQPLSSSVMAGLTRQATP